MRKYNKNEYNREYNKKNYKQLKIYLSADEREQIQSHAAMHGEAVGAFLKRAAAAQIERDRAEDERRAAEAARKEQKQKTAPRPPEDMPALTPGTSQHRRGRPRKQSQAGQLSFVDDLEDNDSDGSGKR